MRLLKSTFLESVYLKIFGRTNAKITVLSKEMKDLNLAIIDIKKSLAEDKYATKLKISTNYPYAFQSQDFLVPKGASEDRTRCPAFVRDVQNLFRRKIRYLDLGCSNGGLVYDFLLQGNVAFGIEGSDFGLTNQSQHWRVIPDFLGNADLTKQFQVSDNGVESKFDVIGAWEVLEHISAGDLPTFFLNVYNHLADGGIFMASVAQFPDFDPVTGQKWHITIESRDWWIKQFSEFGFSEITIPAGFHFPRGDGNPTVYDWDAKANPESGFHVFLKRT